MNVATYLVLITSVSAGACTAQHGKDDEARPIELPDRGLCAHRGAMDTHPENTLAAFREAIRVGAHMIEFDVWVTKDGELVVMHDATVDRTTDGKGRVWDLTLAEIKQLDAGSWKSPEFKGERIPTLKETLAIMPRNVWLNIHLYGDTGLAEKAAKMIAGENRLHQAFLACPQVLAKAARAVEPRILICNMDRRDTSSRYVQETIAMKADFIQLTKLCLPEIYEHARKLKKNRIRINYYGTDSAETLRTLFSAGVAFPLANRIGSTMKVAEELGIQPLQPRYQ